MSPSTSNPTHALFIQAHANRHSQTADYPSVSASNVNITIDSSPHGLGLVIVDGNQIATPTVFSWANGSRHTLSAVGSVSCGGSCQYAFNYWSDGEAQTHRIIALNSQTTYTATYELRYLLTINSNAGGTTAPSTAWQNAHAVVQILATPNNGYYFVSWTGSDSGGFSGSSATATVTMNGPITEDATFAPTNTTVSQANTEQVTITSNPTIPGSISVDGTLVTTPQIFTWAIGTTHILTAPPTTTCLNLDGSTYSCQALFQDWWAPSNGFVNSSTFSYTVPSSSEIVTAFYQLQTPPQQNSTTITTVTSTTLTEQGPDFALSVSPSTVFLPPGNFIGSTEFILNLTSIQGWKGGIDFVTSPLPAGVTFSNLPSKFSFSSPIASWDVQVNIGPSAQSGSYTVLIVASSGSLIHSTSVIIEVAGSTAMPEFPSGGGIVFLVCFSLAGVLMLDQRRSRNLRS